ncbi:MAG: serine/threonine-protein kinase, partial [Verrucomicrobiota bacterium]
MPEGDSSPIKIGRYLIEGTIGEGGFGLVYLAYDINLDRQVALKVQNQDKLVRALDLCAREARSLAALRHPNIVTVYEAQESLETGDFYIVSSYIEGGTLADEMLNSRLSFERTAYLIQQIASAIQHAHQRNIVHRDIKPSNIMIDAEGDAVLIDFGVALGDENYGERWAKNAGTPTYMSPEQARGEGHLLDGRSDIFSLGLVMYEMLTGESPNQCKTLQDMADSVARVMCSPRELDSSIPFELERICLKAITLSPDDRYQNAKELEQELQLYRELREPSAAAAGLHPMVPKGLSSFDETDAEFFPSLLPGPRDRTGLPESIRFWQRKIEERDSAKTFRIGFIFGPSGSGKSSFIKAGVIPRLRPEVTTVTITTSDQRPAHQLHNVLLKYQGGKMSRGATAGDSMRQIRLRSNAAEGKLLLVFDQFERVFYAPESERRQLSSAIRQCDGSRLQVILLVRDDYWLKTSRFAADLQTEVVLGTNSRLMDLFDLKHTESVLQQIGRAYQCFSGIAEKSARQFIHKAASALCANGESIPVQLTLFTEVFRSRKWQTDELERIGGMSGIAEVFLNNTFDDPSAPIRNREHAKAAFGVLTRLLPGEDVDLSTGSALLDELQLAAGYGPDSDRF